MKRYFVYILLLILSFSSPSFSQKPPIKFGKVSKSELQMTTYEPDTSASAVILCHYGRFSVSDYRFTENIRIKILKKTGYEWGELPIRAGDDIIFKGYTFNLENGEVIKDKLRNESIFKEKLFGDAYVYNIAMPNVKVGSVIDLQISRLFLPSEWRFQETIPVKHNELIIEPSQYIRWRKNLVGSFSYKMPSSDHWIADNVPAFKPEPYIDSDENYIAKFEIEVQSIQIPGVLYEDFASSWNAVNKDLIENSYFGYYIDKCIFLNKPTKDLQEKYTNEDKLIEEAFKLIKEVKWNEKERLYTTRNNLSYPFNEKIGNSADINLLLVALLRKLDIEAYPLAISTRDNGMLNPFSPSSDKLNYVLACVKKDDNYILLDATDQYLPVGLIPKRCINDRGIIVDMENKGWVELSSKVPYKKSSFYTLTLNPDLSLTGEVAYSKEDYAAYYFRKNYSGYTSEEEYLENMESDNNGLRIDKMEITDLDSLHKPVKIKETITLDNQVNAVGDLLYMEPLLIEKITENPFKLDERKYPVDFAYPFDESAILVIDLPDNIEVVEMPKNARIVLPDNGGELLYSMAQIGRKLQVRCQFKINKIRFTGEEYPYLKELYNQYVAKCNEPVILKMK